MKAHRQLPALAILLFIVILISTASSSFHDSNGSIFHTKETLMKKEIIYTKNAPQPIGPYSQAVKMNGMLFISGQIAIDPSSGNLVLSDISSETHQVMKNLQAILTEAGMSFSDVMKTTIFLSDMQHFSAVNEVYGSYFTSEYPARETVQAAVLPKNVNVEISIIASK